MKTTRLIATLLMLSVASTTLWAQEIKGNSGDFSAGISKSFTVQPGGKLEIQAFNSDIKIVAWNKETIQIKHDMEIDTYTREEAAEIAERVERGYTQRGNTINIQTVPHGRRDHNKLDIMLPEQFDVDINLLKGDITLSGVNGNIIINSTDGDIVLRQMNGDFNIQTASGDLGFYYIDGNLKASSAGGDVELQQIAARTEIRTAGGDIELNDAENSVSLITAGGDVQISNCKKSVVAETRGGDIKVENVTGSVNLVTSGGDIEIINIDGKVNAATKGGEINGENLGAQIDVETMGGEIVLENVRTGARVKTFGGDIHFEMTLKNFNKPHAVDLETMGGSIVAKLPSKLPAYIHAEIRFDPQKSLFKRFDIYSDFPLTKSPPDENEDKKLISTGEINEGGDKITLKANGGDIYIKKTD
ncbi:DUF4097 family beta strand repeat protein [candidate division KSB1 bacterium]|nr:DUF4097 family beta strand repeat protein [candidate division KSB1 bacterium]